MLRLVFRAPSIRASSVSVCSWRRFNATQRPVDSGVSTARDAVTNSGSRGTPVATGGSVKLQTSETTKSAPSAKEVQDVVSSLENDPTVRASSNSNLRFDDDEDVIDESLLFASETEPVKPADSEAELFGEKSSGSSSSNETSQLDPHSLPRPYSSLPPNPTEAEYASALIHGRSIHLPYYHPPTHHIPAASIQFRSHHPRLLDLFTHFASHAASALGIPISRVVYLPTQRSLWTVPRSPFAHKKSQENFERRVHKRAIKAFDADPEVIDRWARYLRRHALAGVGMRIVRWERMPLSIGASRLDWVLESLNKTTEDAEKIKRLGDKIVQQEMAILEMDAEKASQVEAPSTN